MRIIAAILTIMTVLALAQPISEADAARSTVDCATDDLQAAIDNAAPGTRLQVRGTCVGNFTITRDIRIIGRGGATLRGGDVGTLLTISAGANVVLSDLMITGGRGNTIDSPSYAPRVGGIENAGSLVLNGSTAVVDNSAFSGVGGIINTGTLRLNDNATVRENGGGYISAAGVSNRGTLVMNDRSSISGNRSGCSGCSTGGVGNSGIMVMNDRSSVHDNVATQLGGGVSNFGTLTLKDRSSIHHNDAFTGAGIHNAGTVVLKDRSSVRDNTARGSAGGIWNTGGTVVGWAMRVFNNTPDQCNGC